MKSLRYILYSAFLIFPLTTFTQSNTSNPKFHKNAKEENDTVIINEFLSKNKISESAQKTPINLLAESARLMGDSFGATYWYGLIVKGGKAQPIQILHYAQALQRNGNYEEAKLWFLEYQKSIDFENESRIRLADICDIASNLAFEEDVVVTNMERLNSEHSDFSPMFYNNGLVFTSTRNNKKVSSQKNDRWTKGNSMEMYFAKVRVDDLTSEVDKFIKNARTKFYNGTASFAPNQKTMYFTGSNLKYPKKKKIKSDKQKLKIYQTFFDGMDWINIQELPFNDDQYDTTHPSINQDGNVLFFSSNRPGGLGGMDLYQCQKTKTGWSEPKNLGESINTSKDEVFPFIHEDQSLYFASNGLPGQGGLDIFRTEKIQLNALESTWARPQNLGSPINSTDDDFGLVVDYLGIKGYLSSNRSGGKGQEDIYSFICKNGIYDLTPGVAESTLVTTQLQVIDKESNESLAEVSIQVNPLSIETQKGGEDNLKDFDLILHPIEGSLEKFSLDFIKKDNKSSLATDNQYFTDHNGVFNPLFLTNAKYQITFTKMGYEPLEVEFSYIDFLKKRKTTFQMKKLDCLSFEGKVFDKNHTGKVIPNSTITILNKCNESIEKLTTDQNGVFTFCLDCNCEYEILASKNYFSADLKLAKDINCKEMMMMHFFLEKKKDIMLKADPLNKINTLEKKD